MLVSQNLNSSTIQLLAYDPITLELLAVFKGRGTNPSSAYLYNDVPLEVWNLIHEAHTLGVATVGQTFDIVIKKKNYTFTKVAG